MAASAQQPAQGSYRIGAGDVLDIVIWRNKDLTMPVVVRPDGFISFPIVNEVEAAGLTPAALARKIEAGLAASVTSPTVTTNVPHAVPVRKIFAQLSSLL
jgi:polysaccharide export outer membrane protein